MSTKVYTVKSHFISVSSGRSHAKQLTSSISSNEYSLHHRKSVTLEHGTCRPRWRLLYCMVGMLSSSLSKHHLSHGQIRRHGEYCFPRLILAVVRRSPVGTELASCVQMMLPSGSKPLCVRASCLNSYEFPTLIRADKRIPLAFLRNMQKS